MSRPTSPGGTSQPNPASTPSALAAAAKFGTPQQNPTSTKMLDKLTKLVVAAPLTGKENWKGWKGTVLRWAKGNTVGKHFKADPTKQGKPAASKAMDVEEWEQRDMLIFGAIEAKLSESIQSTISLAESTGEMWDCLCLTYDITDMVAIVTSKQALYTQRMLEGEKIEDHL